MWLKRKTSLELIGYILTFFSLVFIAVILSTINLRD